MATNVTRPDADTISFKSETVSTDADANYRKAVSLSRSSCASYFLANWISGKCVLFFYWCLIAMAPTVLSGLTKVKSGVNTVKVNKTRTAPVCNLFRMASKRVNKVHTALLLLSTLEALMPNNCAALPAAAGFGQASLLTMALPQESAGQRDSSRAQINRGGLLLQGRRTKRAKIPAFVTDSVVHSINNDDVVIAEKNEAALTSKPLEQQDSVPTQIFLTTMGITEDKGGQAAAIPGSPVTTEYATDTSKEEATDTLNITSTPKVEKDDDFDENTQSIYVPSLPVHGTTTLRPMLHNAALIASMRFKDLIPPTYDRLKWPAPESGTPVRVSLAVALGKLQSVDEAQKTVTFDLCLELSWREPRLRLPRNLSVGEAIPLPAELIKHLWTPDPYILNLRSLDSASIVKPPTGLEIAGDKTVRMTVLGAATIGCSMDFREYPVDTQVCRVRIQSFEYEIESLVFEWGAALGTFAKLGSEDFIVETIQLAPYNKTYTGSSMWNGRRFSRLEFRLVLQRRFSYHLLETYLPSVLFTMCAWLSFLVPRSSIPGRMALCVTTLLSMTAMVAAVKKFTPHSQYIKAIEVWLLTCLCFIFYALFAFLLAIKIASFEKTIKRARAIRRPGSTINNKAPTSSPAVRYTVSSSTRRNNRNVNSDVEEAKNDGPKQISIIQQEGTLPIGIAPSDFFGRSTSLSTQLSATPTRGVDSWKRRADWFEFASFIGYAVAFIIFAIWYWSKLLEASEHYKFFIPHHD